MRLLLLLITWVVGGPMLALWIRRRTGYTSLGLIFVVLWFLLPNLDGIVARPMLAAWAAELPNIMPEPVTVKGFLNASSEDDLVETPVRELWGRGPFTYEERRFTKPVELSLADRVVQLPAGYVQFYDARPQDCDGPSTGDPNGPFFVRAPAGRNGGGCLRVERTDRPISKYEYIGTTEIDPGESRRRWGLRGWCSYVRVVATGRDFARSCTLQSLTVLMWQNRVVTGPDLGPTTILRPPAVAALPEGAPP